MRDGFPPNFLDPSNVIRQPDHAARRGSQQPADDGAAVRRRVRAADRRATSSSRPTSSARSTDPPRRAAQPQPERCRARSTPTAPLPYPDVRQRAVARDDRRRPTTRASTCRSRSGSATATAIAPRTPSASARDQAPEHLNASSGRPQNGRDLESWEGPSDFDIRHRFVANFIAELPFGEGKPMLQDGVGRQDPRRLAGERHLQRPLRPAVHGDAGQQQRRRRRDRPAESDRRPAGCRDGRAVVQPGGVHAGAVGHVRQRRPQHPARTGLGDLRHERAAADRLQRPRQRDAAVGHLQHVQSRQLRAARHATSSARPPA